MPCEMFGWIAQRRLKALSALGKVSMTIYLVHILAGSGARIVLMKLFSINNLAVHLFFGVCCGVLVSISLELFVKKAGCGWLFFVPDFMSVEIAYGEVDLYLSPSSFDVTQGDRLARF